MNILLLTPIISMRDLWGRYEKGGGHHFPIGLLYIAGATRESGYDVDLLDATALRYEEDDLVEYLGRKIYDVIGFGNAYTAHMHAINKTAKIVKRVQSNAKLVVGGTHPTLFPEETLKRFSEFDIAISNEGETSFVEVLEHFKTEEKALSQIQGISFRVNGGVVSNPPRIDIKPMSELPDLPYDLLEIDKYVLPPSNYRVLPSFSFMVSRGCPYQCTYCDTRVHGRKMRYNNVERAVSQLKDLKEKYGMKGVYFLDSIFTVNRNFTVALCEEMIKETLDIQWCCQTRVNCVDPELLDLMKRAGCWNISFGLESGNDDTLKLMKKVATVAEARVAVENCKKYGIQITGFFILCLPFEDKEMTMNTIRFAKKLALDITIFFLPVPFLGTELFEQCKKIGGLRENIDWDDYRQWMDHRDPLWVNPLIGKEDMIRLYNYAVRSFYMSPKTLLRAILNIRSLTELKKYIKGFYSVKDTLKESMRFTK